MKFKLVDNILDEEDKLVEDFSSYFSTIGHYDPELDLVVFTKEEMEDWD